MAYLNGKSILFSPKILLTDNNDELPIIRKAIASKGGTLATSFSNVADAIKSIPVGDPNYTAFSDTETAYRKTIRAGASSYGEIVKIGGMSYRDEATNTLKHAKVSEIKGEGANLCPKASITSDENQDGKIEIVGIQPSGKYTLSCNITRYQDDSATKARVTIKFTYTDGSYDMASGFWDNESVENDGLPRHKYVTLESDSTKTIRVITLICLDWGTVPSRRNAKAENICLCYGTDNEYKPYVGTLDTFTIPNEVKNREGYGLGVPNEDCNYITYTEDGKVKEAVKYKEVDLGTLTWYETNSTVGTTYHAYIEGMKLPVSANDRKMGFVCSRYAPSTVVDTTKLDDKGIICHGSGSYFIRDSEYSDATSFKSAMAGVMLVYELAEPIETDITSLMPKDNYIAIEAGGSVKFVNDHEIASPNTISYTINNS